MQAVAVTAIGVAVVGTAALGTFVGGGLYEPLARLGRATSVVTIIPGLMLAGSVALGIAVVFVGTREAVGAGMRSTGYAIAGDGSIVRRTIVQRFFPPSQQVVAVSDLQGHATKRYQDSVARGKLTTGVISTPAINLHPEIPGTLESMFIGYRGTREIFVQLTTLPPTPSELSWYFVRKAGLIAAYDTRSARLIGWMGPDGFSTGDSLPAHRFEGALLPNSEYAYFQTVLAFPSAVYRLDLPARGIRRIFTASPNETVLGAVTSGDSTQHCCIRTARKVRRDRDQHERVRASCGWHRGGQCRKRFRHAQRHAHRLPRRPRARDTHLFLVLVVEPAIHSRRAGHAAGHITAFADGDKIVAQAAIPRDTAPQEPEKMSAGELLSAAAVPLVWRFTPRVYRFYHQITGSPASSPGPGGDRTPSTGACPHLRRSSSLASYSCSAGYSRSTKSGGCCGPRSVSCSGRSAYC